mmetsp:Transcript_4959/g.16585  ORF Transcript_4959/g.16585 Transcript_4959/m.16585 type:complete len:554 (-) Transcript_4959:471-2132(-)
MPARLAPAPGGRGDPPRRCGHHGHGPPPREAHAGVPLLRRPALLGRGGVPRGRGPAPCAPRRPHPGRPCGARGDAPRHADAAGRGRHGGAHGPGGRRGRGPRPLPRVPAPAPDALRCPTPPGGRPGAPREPFRVCALPGPGAPPGELRGGRGPRGPAPEALGAPLWRAPGAPVALLEPLAPPQARVGHRASHGRGVRSRGGHPRAGHGGAPGPAGPLPHPGPLVPELRGLRLRGVPAHRRGGGHPAPLPRPRHPARPHPDRRLQRAGGRRRPGRRAQAAGALRPGPRAVRGVPQGAHPAPRGRGRRGGQPRGLHDPHPRRGASRRCRPCPPRALCVPPKLARGRARHPQGGGAARRAGARAQEHPRPEPQGGQGARGVRERLRGLLLLHHVCDAPPARARGARRTDGRAGAPRAQDERRAGQGRHRERPGPGLVEQDGPGHAHGAPRLPARLVLTAGATRRSRRRAGPRGGLQPRMGGSQRHARAAARAGGRGGARGRRERAPGRRARREDAARVRAALQGVPAVVLLASPTLQITAAGSARVRAARTGTGAA